MAVLDCMAHTRTPLAAERSRCCARYELGPERRRPGDRGGVPVRAAAPGPDRRDAVRAAVAGMGGLTRLGGGPSPPWRGMDRAAGPPAAAGGVRGDLDLRRHLAGPAEDGRRPAVAGHRVHRGEFAGVGAAPGQLGRDGMVLPPDPGGCLGGMDPGRARHLAARRGPGPLVQARRTGQHGLGTGRVGVGRVLRRDLRPRPDLAVRRAGGGAAVLRGRRAVSGRAPATASRAR